MVHARVVLGCLATAVAVAGCTVGSRPTPTSGDASALGPGGSATISSRPSPGGNPSATPTDAPVPCPTAGPPVELGSSGFDDSPRRLVRVSAGRYRLTATGFLHGGLFDPEVGQTAVVWGHTSTTPTYEPGPATVTGVVGSAVVVEGAETWVDLPGGTLWFLNSNGVHISLAACPPATVTRL